MNRLVFVPLALLTAAPAARTSIAPPTGSAVPAPAAEPAGVKATMLKEISPAFTDVSFLLFHSEGPKERLVEATGRLDDAIAKFSRGTAKSHGQEEFRVSAVLLRSSMEGLKLAVLNDAPRGELEHWFGHVGAACNTCHAEVRGK